MKQYRYAMGLPLTAVLVSACVAEGDMAMEDTGETAQTLSTADWSSASTVGSDIQCAQYLGAMAELDGVTYMVHSGCSTDHLWWTKNSGGGWTNDQEISGQNAYMTVSLATYNGYIYMLHSGRSDTRTNVWMSRFDPSSETWTSNTQLSYSSNETPAIAEYNSRLYIVGIDPSDNKLWMATMNSSETFSASSRVSGQYSNSRVSLANFGGRLYVAHRDHSGSTIKYNSYDGSSWRGDATIPAGTSGASIQGYAPSIATHGSYLHLVHKRTSGSSVYWTYFDGSSWASEVTIPSTTSSSHPSLAEGGGGLVLLTNIYYGTTYGYTLYVREYDGP